jgi:predicted negative regulator of RcsB-dependent stress response
MAYDLQEQEQIESLKIFWNQWGKWIAAAVVGLALGYIGFKGYRSYETRQVEASATLYSGLERSAQGQDLAAVKTAAARIETDYAMSPYAPRAAFLAARLGFEKNDEAFVKDQLGWVIGHAKEPALVALAHLRLSSVLLDEKQYDAALAELDSAHDSAFDALYFDAKGDVYALKGDKGAARDAYQAALAKLTGDAPNRSYIQTKLDALGG